MNIAYSEAELRSVLQAVLVQVCNHCDFVHGEALRPSGNSCLVQSGASYCTTKGAADFHRSSLNFYFPPNVSVAGRVWKSGCTEWHEDVSVLPSTIFLRAELALQTELKACFAMPLCKDSRVLAVCIFYSRYALPANAQMEQTCLGFANEVLATTFTRSHMDPTLRFLSGDPNVGEAPPSKAAASKSWQRCQLALDSAVEERTEEQMEQIAKFSKGVQFFKYITNTQRYQLCKTMTYTQLVKNQVVMHGVEAETSEPNNTWHVVVSGRVDMCVKTHAEGKIYRMCSFKDGDTFAASYMKMFSTAPGISAHIEATTDATCIVVTIPDEFKSELRTCTRPLWYEELAQYFHMSINEAAEVLGMCMSAIKKICRRHGISRWPHRKLASVNKTVAMLQSKINTAEDEASRAALRSEAVNVLTMKLRLTINPAYLVRDETVLMQPLNAGNIPGGMQAMAGGPGLMGFGRGAGFGHDDMDGRGGMFPGHPGAQIDMSHFAERGYPMMQRNALMAQAEAQAAANAASVLQKVQSVARARAGAAGAGAEGGGQMGMMGYPNMPMPTEAMLQQQRLMMGQDASGAAAGGGARRKGDEGSGEGGAGFENAEGSQKADANAAGAAGGPPGGMPYGMPGHFHGMSGYGQGPWNGPGGFEAGFGRGMPDALLQQRMMSSFGGYGMSGPIGQGGVPPGTNAPPAAGAAASGTDAANAGKRPSKNEATSAPAPPAEGESAEKRARQH